MAKKVTGMVAQFGTKGYGFIEGDDGERYFVHQKNIYHKSRLKMNTRVIFNAESSEKGLVAKDVKLEKLGIFDLMPLSDGAIKRMFAVLFITQIIVLYQVFFLS